MATPTTITGAAGKVRFEYGVTEEVAFKWVSPKAVTGAYGPQFMWTLADERKIYLDDEDGADVDRRLQELGVQPGDCVRITKIRHARGGGHSFRVEAVSDAAEPDTELASRLKESVAIAKSGVRPRAEVAMAAEGLSPAALKLAAAFSSAIDALSEAQAYAERKSLRVAFTAEDVRCVALSVYIGMERGR